jgi:hypothetical protein
MNGIVDTTTKTSTPHVVDLVIRNGMMLAVCRCGQVLLRMPAQLPQAERAARLQDSIRFHLGRVAVVLLCCVLWSCVMSQNANAIHISISKLSRMSDAQLRELDRIAMGGAPAPAKPLPHIEIDDIPNAAQAALVSMSFDAVAKAVTKALKNSTVRFGARDFALLRSLGLAERQPDTIWHRLTDDGKGYARMVARRIAKEMGLHSIHTEIRSFKHEIAHCSCGWQRSLYSEKFGGSG